MATRGWLRDLPVNEQPQHSIFVGMFDNISYGFGYRASRVNAFSVFQVFFASKEEADAVWSQHRKWMEENEGADFPGNAYSPEAICSVYDRDDGISGFWQTNPMTMIVALLCYRRRQHPMESVHDDFFHSYFEDGWANTDEIYRFLESISIILELRQRPRRVMRCSQQRFKERFQAFQMEVPAAIRANDVIIDPAVDADDIRVPRHVTRADHDHVTMALDMGPGKLHLAYSDVDNTIFKRWDTVEGEEHAEQGFCVTP